MVTQIGISMIVPIFLGVFLGYRLDRWLGTGFFFLVFLLLGILAAFRNIYKLTKPFYAEDLKREREEQAYWDSLKPGGQTSPGADVGSLRGEGLGAGERRRRIRLFAEQGNGAATPKSRRETVEEEFAAWRREREKSHDGSAGDDTDCRIGAGDGSGGCGDDKGGGRDDVH